MDFDDGPRGFDDWEPNEESARLPAELEETVERLRETLTDDMIVRAFRCRCGEDPADEDDLEVFADDLIAEAVNAGYDEWNEAFLVWD